MNWIAWHLQRLAGWFPMNHNVSCVGISNTEKSLGDNIALAADLHAQLQVRSYLNDNWLKIEGSPMTICCPTKFCALTGMTTKCRSCSTPKLAQGSMFGLRGGTSFNLGFSIGTPEINLISDSDLIWHFWSVHLNLYHLIYLILSDLTYLDRSWQSDLPYVDLDPSWWSLILILLI